MFNSIKKSRRRCVLVLLTGGILFGASGCGKADKAYDKAMELAEAASYEKAVDSFEEAIQENSEKAEYYIGYGMTLNYLARYEDAIEQFQKAYQEVDNKISRQNNKQLYYGEAVAYYGLHDYDKTVEQCEKALEIKEIEEMNGDIYSALALAQWSLGEKEEAIQTYTKLLKENPADTKGYLQRAELETEQGDLDAAGEDYDRAIKQDEECYDAYFGRYEVYMAKGQEDAAKETLEKITSMNAREKEEKLQIGRAYYVLGDYEQAESYLKDAVKDKCTEGNYYLGMIQMDQEDYEGAIKYFTEYVEGHTGDAAGLTIPEVYNQMAGCAMELQEYDEAEEYLKQGLALGTTSAYQGLLKNQVILYEKRGEYKEARRAAKTYLEAWPEDQEMKKELRFIKTRIK